MRSFFKFNIKYIDELGIEREIEIRPQDLGIDLDYLNAHKIPIRYKDGTEGFYQYPYPIRDINYWFFYEAGFKKDSKSLANSLMQRYYKYKLQSCIKKTYDTQIKKLKDNDKAMLRAAKAGMTYENQYKNRYTMKQFVDISLRVSSTYLRGYHIFDYSNQTGKDFDVSIPIMYAESYRCSKTMVNPNFIHPKNFQLFNYPMELITSKTALESAIKTYLDIDESNLSKQDISFRRSMIFYISEYLAKALKNSISKIMCDPNYIGAEEMYNRIKNKLELRKELAGKGKDQSEFIKDVIDDAGDLLLSGSYKDGSVHFYVFLSNLIAQMKAHELSKGIDELGSRNYSLVRTNKLYRGGIFNELHHKSVQEIFNTEERDYQDKILYDIAMEENRDEITYQDVEEELLGMNRLYYPDMDDDAIREGIIYPDSSETQHKR